MLIEKIVLQYAEADLCTKLVDTKQILIFEFDDGTAIAESLDIVEKIDKIGNADRILNSSSDLEKTINNHIETTRKSINALFFPRNIKTNLPVFATDKAIEYFQHKKKQMRITFNEALKRHNGSQKKR